VRAAGGTPKLAPRYAPTRPGTAARSFSGPSAARPRAPLLRVLFVTHTLPPTDRPHTNIGGMQRGAMELLRTLGQHPRVELSSMVLHTSTRWEAVLTVGFIARILATLPRRARQAQADVVFFSAPVTAISLNALKRRLGGRPVVAIMHGLDVTWQVPPYQVAVRGMFRLLDAVFPISRATAEECLRRGAPPERVHVIPFGVDTDRFTAAPDRDAMRRAVAERLGLPEGAFVLVGLGRQVKRKGTAWFVEYVLPRLPPHVHYAVAGEGPEMDRIKEVAGPVKDRLHLLGRVSEEDLLTVLRGSDLFVMPNVPVEGDMEGQGLVMLEAGLCGLPAIAADMEGISDVVAEGESGHLVPSMDAAAFTERILRYTDDPARLADLSRRTIAHVEQTFSWPAIADRYVTVMEGLVAAKRAS